MKTRQVSNPKSLVQDSTTEGPKTNEATDDSEKLAKRQQMIAKKKRMMRRSRNQAVVSK